MCYLRRDSSRCEKERRRVERFASDPRFLVLYTWHHFPAAFGDYLIFLKSRTLLLKQALREKATQPFILTSGKLMIALQDDIA